MKRYRVDVIVENQEYKSWMAEDYAKIVLGGIFVAENDCSEDEIYCQVKKWIWANIDLSKVQSPQMQFHMRVNEKYSDFYIFENSINQLNRETMKEETKKMIKSAGKGVGEYVGTLLKAVLLVPILVFMVVSVAILDILKGITLALSGSRTEASKVMEDVLERFTNK